MMKRLFGWALAIIDLRDVVNELYSEIMALQDKNAAQSAAIAKLHQELHVLKRRDRKDLKETARAEAKKAVRDVVDSKADAMKGELAAKIGASAISVGKDVRRQANQAIDEKFAAYSRTNREWVQSIVGRLDEAEGKVRDIGGTLMRLLGGLQKAVAPDDGDNPSLQMERIKDIHRAAMEWVDEAESAQRDGDGGAAKAAFAHAFRASWWAAGLVEASTVEPDRSVLHRSAAELAIKAGQPSAAINLAYRGLEGNPPAEIAEELRDVLARAKEARR